MNGTITREQIDRVRIEAPDAERVSVMQWIRDRGYKFVEIGPKQTEHGVVDLSTVVAVGERSRTSAVNVWTKQVLA